MSNMIVQEVNVLDIVKDVGKKNKRLQAALLSEIEKYMESGTSDFQQLRKFVLDETNGYTRDIINDVFGNVEYLLR